MRRNEGYIIDSNFSMNERITDTFSIFFFEAIVYIMYWGDTLFRFIL